MFSISTIEEITRISHELSVDPAALLAVVEVESAGELGEGGKPWIRIEGHYFDQRLRGPKREQARRLGLSSPIPGKVKNPAKLVDRYKMLDLMAAIDHKAAYESCSWGLGQVMGANWIDLGYTSVDELVKEAMSGVGGQVRVMARFIKANHLIDELQRRDWPAFARAYNGPGYAKGGYHTRMTNAYKRWAGRVREPVMGRPTLQLGSKGHSVRELQESLRIRSDGVFGPTTENAVKAFQHKHGLQVDGIVGPKTWALVDDVSHMQRMGSAGRTVFHAQELLRKAGYMVRVDGDYGPATKEAVRQFQRDNGLNDDGILGPLTWNKLEAAQVPAKFEAPTVVSETVGKVTTAAGGAGAAVAEITNQIQETTMALNPLTYISQYAAYAFIGLTLVGVGLTIYGIWKRSQKIEVPA